MPSGESKSKVYNIGTIKFNRSNIAEQTLDVDGKTYFVINKHFDSVKKQTGYTVSSRVNKENIQICIPNIGGNLKLYDLTPRKKFDTSGIKNVSNEDPILGFVTLDTSSISFLTTLATNLFSTVRGAGKSRRNNNNKKSKSKKGGRKTRRNK
jgi:hypothetical protein